MTYQTLYRKYRSQTFADLVGQEAVTRALQGAISSGRVAHAYLFSGSRGTGKTSSARLLAKALNCLNRAPGSGEPCNSCEMCRAIAEGNALDVIEIDAASNNGVDNIRELRERVRLVPSQGSHKVYIIDEAHMLSGSAFDAFLKTLEEPPPNVVFVLCTTEANKVPLTVLGRCQQFPFRRITEEAIAQRLAHVAAAEGIAIDADALGLLARTAEGSMRDAIGYLDQLAPLTGGSIDVAEARSLLGIADPLAVASLFDAVIEGRAHDALHGLNGLYEGGADLRPMVRALMERCRDLLVRARCMLMPIVWEEPFGMVLIEAAEIDRATFLEVAAASAAGSPFVKYKIEPLLRDDYSATFTTEMMLNDVELILDQASRSATVLPVTRELRRLLAETAATYGDLDFMSLFLQLRNVTNSS